MNKLWTSIRGDIMREENKKLNIDWSKFKSKANGKTLQDTKSSYIEFCKMLDETDFELVDRYKGNKDKVDLVYKCDYNIKLNIRPNDFKTHTYKSIINFKNKLRASGDEFVKFAGLSNKRSLIAQIKTFDGGVVDIDVRNYDSWNRGRKDFYDKFKDVDGHTNDHYIGKEAKIDIYIDGVKLNSICPNGFKTQTYKTIVNFKNNLKENNDEFIKFVGLTNGNTLIAKIKTYDGGVVDLDIRAYSKFNKARQDFYNKLKEVNGYTKEFYKGNNTNIDLYIDNVKLNPINFKSQTYKTIINFKKGLEKNKDKLIKFIGLTNGNSLISKIKTFDNIILNIDIANYNSFNKSRQNTYNYCKENGYEVLSPYIGNNTKILIDFNCEHDPHWIKPNDLKNNQGCPVCNESKGEKIIRYHLEKNNIEFKQEYRFSDCKYRIPLPFDFYIPKHNLCIEFDGEQHYKAYDHFGGEEKLRLTQKRDKIKNDYCRDNGLNLLRIPYWNIDSIEKILDEEFERLRKELKEAC